MPLTLTRPLCFFDLETTGTNISNDRIVEIAVLKRHPDGAVEEARWLAEHCDGCHLITYTCICA